MHELRTGIFFIQMIASLSLENFRNFGLLDLKFKDRSIILTGANGQGKTSVLEAIFFLANLRSFRTLKVREMQKLGTGFFRLSCILNGGAWNTKLELENSDVRRLRIDGVPVPRASGFTGRVRTIAFLPDDSAIIGGSAILRRRFFDMFISMTDPNYFTALQLYSRALKERNFLLRSPSFDPEILRSYHPILAENGSFIMKKRREYAKMLTDSMRLIFEKIRPEFQSLSVKMRYSREIDSSEAFLRRLDTHIEYDRERGCTACGPHLDDFDFVVNDRNLRIYGSNGQKRIASFALKMAEFDIVGASAEQRKNTVVIVDDATGDLDYRTKNAFFDKIHTAGQVFFAFTDIENNPVFNRSQIITLSSGKAV